jgi:hypothetical protein
VLMLLTEILPSNIFESRSFLRDAILALERQA